MTTDVLPEQKLDPNSLTTNGILIQRYLDTVSKARAKRLKRLNADKGLQSLEDVAAWLETKPEMSAETLAFYQQDVALLSAALDKITPTVKEAAK